METPHCPSVSSICDTIGRRRIALALRVTLTSVSNHVTAGLFPARWFDVIEGLCLARGLECPRTLFSFVRPDEELSDAVETPEDAA